MIPVEQLIKDIKSFDNEFKAVSAICTNARSLKGTPEFEKYSGNYMKYFEMTDAWNDLSNAVEKLNAFVSNENNK